MPYTLLLLGQVMIRSPVGSRGPHKGSATEATSKLKAVLSIQYTVTQGI